MKHLRQFIFCVSALAALGGCASLAPGIYVSDDALEHEATDLGGEADLVLRVNWITADLIRTLTDARERKHAFGQSLLRELRPDDAYVYRIGVGDILSFTVWEHPELTIPAGQFRDPAATGHRVDENGNIFFPFIGETPVAGKTLTEVRTLVTERLSEYIRRPQVDLRVASFRSQRIQVTGQVNQPGTIPLTDIPMTVIDALNFAGGERPTTADLSHVRLTRDKHTVELDLYALLEDGDTVQNLTLQDGDVLNVPDNTQNKVYVFGEVNDQGVRYMEKGEMSLAGALGFARGLNQTTADSRRIYVLRGLTLGIQPQVYQLDANRPDALVMSTSFPLEADDVVYVATSDVTRWNRVISQLLPTINLADRLSN